ncbi:MAG: phosphatase PAP2 family protein [Oscillospiraceae bacterium]|nr:phosphatase PAP2 family protein [Oscillospiraceae bacterium]
MKTQTVDYRHFRLSKINSPEFSHLKLLLGWVVYFVMYFVTERLIPVESCHVIHSRLDDMIPFCEYFVIPYVGWYFLVFGSLLYFLFYNVPSFTKLQKYIIFTQVVAMAIYILYPNMQDLRPEIFPRDNILSRLVGVLYTADTNTNVFPSLHVGYSIAIASVWLKEKNASVLWKSFVVMFVVLVCLSTAFIKQHSVLDAFAAMAMCLIAEVIVYRDWWKTKIQG